MGDSRKMTGLMGAMAAQMTLIHWLSCDVPPRLPEDELLALGEPWTRFDNELGLSLRLSKPYIELGAVREAIGIKDEERDVWFEAFAETFADEIIRLNNASLPVDLALYDESPAGFGYWAFLAVVIVLTLRRLTDMAAAGENLKEVHVGDLLRKIGMSILVSRFNVDPPEELKGFKLLIPSELRFVFGRRGMN